jgi:hypothetical protein
MVGGHRRHGHTAAARRLRHTAGDIRGEVDLPRGGRWTGGRQPACPRRAWRHLVRRVAADGPATDDLPAAGHPASGRHWAADHRVADDRMSDLADGTASYKDDRRRREVANRRCLLADGCFPGNRHCGAVRRSVACSRRLFDRHRSTTCRRWTTYRRRTTYYHWTTYRRCLMVSRRDMADRPGWTCRLLIGWSRLPTDRRDCRRRLDQPSGCFPPRCQR